MRTKKWVKCCAVFMLLGAMVVSGIAEDDDQDLYDLASESADEQVEVADEVLAEDEREHGKQWLTRDRLVMIAGAWVALQLVILVLVIRDLRRRGSGCLAMCGWVVVILITSFLAGVLYWVRQKRIHKK